MTYYKPMTPKIRSDALSSINKQIEELRTCEQNQLVRDEIAAMNLAKNLISSIPDGFMVPMKETRS